MKYKKTPFDGLTIMVAATTSEQKPCACHINDDTDAAINFKTGARYFAFTQPLLKIFNQ